VTPDFPTGDEPSVVVNAVLAGKGNHGYNAASGEYGDMMAMGVIDPTKVTRTALQNAASIAGLMLTTACMVAESAEDKSAGGMGNNSSFPLSRGEGSSRRCSRILF